MRERVGGEGDTWPDHSRFAKVALGFLRKPGRHFHSLTVDRPTSRPFEHGESARARKLDSTRARQPDFRRSEYPAFAGQATERAGRQQNFTAPDPIDPEACRSRQPRPATDIQAKRSLASKKAGSRQRRERRAGLVPAAGGAARRELGRTAAGAVRAVPRRRASKSPAGLRPDRRAAAPRSRKGLGAKHQKPRIAD